MYKILLNQLLSVWSCYDCDNSKIEKQLAILVLAFYN